MECYAIVKKNKLELYVEKWSIEYIKGEKE
jgi:hypothetical protein